MTKTPRANNYETAKYEGAGLFLTHSQEAMIDRFSLKADETYLYMAFFNRKVRIRRRTGLVYILPEGLAAENAEDKDWQEADFNVSMTLYDYLCTSKPGCKASGEFVTSHSLQAVVTSMIGGSMFDEPAAFFDSHPDQVRQRCIELGGFPGGKGDISYQFTLFADLQIRISFWHSDEEFPAQLVIFWDKNVLDYIKFETTYYAATFLLNEIMTWSAQQGQPASQLVDSI